MILYELYMAKNVRVKRPKSKFVIDFNTFQSLLPKFTLAKDLSSAFIRGHFDPELDKA